MKDTAAESLEFLPFASGWGRMRKSPQFNQKVEAMIRFRSLSLACLISTVACLPVHSIAEDLDEDSPREYGPNRQDEPVAESFSLDRAVEFLDTTSTSWQENRNCMTCHTNYAYLYARPGVERVTDAHQEVRHYAENLVEERWEAIGPRWDAEVVATAAALAFHDDATTGELHQTTRVALDRMWTVQREDGGWSWLKCGWPPMESDDHYGATLAAIAVGVAPEDYASTEQAQQGLERLRAYFSANETPTLHHRAMLLWADSYLDDFVSDNQHESWVKELLEKQKDDGGWALASLGDWERSDGKDQDTETSDGYGTGFVVFVLRRSGLEADHPAIAKGVEWLKTNQRESGRWFTRSLNKDSSHYISHAGSAMAVLALTECGVRE